MIAKKKRRGKGKGSAFERELCSILSRWWSEGRRDDLFWRTGGSGGRAKRRGRTGRSTKNQDGDICSTDPSSQPFMDLFTPEIKRGYNRVSLTDLIDRPLRNAKQLEIEKWISQAMESREQAGSLYWLLIHKRDIRPAVIIFPSRLLLRFKKRGVNFSTLQIVRVNFRRTNERKPVTREFVSTTLEEFLEKVTPRIVLLIHKMEIG